MKMTVLVACMAVLCTGCIMGEIKYHADVTTGDEYSKPFRECRVFFSQFEHPDYQKIRESYQTHQASPWGGRGSTGTSERLVTGTSHVPPMGAVLALQDSGAFKSIVTSKEKEGDYDLILTGKLTSGSWCHWAILPQIPLIIVTFGAFHLVFPTIGLCGEAVCELRLTDREGNLVRSVRTVAKRTDWSTIWGIPFIVPVHLESRMLGRKNLETEAIGYAVERLTAKK